MTTVVGRSSPDSSCGFSLRGQQAGLGFGGHVAVDVARRAVDGQRAIGGDIQHEQVRLPLGVDRPGRADYRQLEIHVELRARKLITSMKKVIN